MILAHLEVAFARRASIAALAAGPGSLVVSCADADVVLVLAALESPSPLGVWLEVGPYYPASLAARDVATLSRLVTLDHVVVSARSRVDAHAEIVRALLDGGEVTLANDAATLVGAFNRPVPPRPVRVWAAEGRELRDREGRLFAQATETIDAGRLTTYRRHPR